MPAPKRHKTVVLALLIGTVGIVAVALTVTSLRGCADGAIDRSLGEYVEQKNPHKAIERIERTFVIDFPNDIGDLHVAISRSYDNWTSIMAKFSVESSLLQDFLKSMASVSLKPYVHKPGFDTMISESTIAGGPSWWWPRPIDNAKCGSFSLVWRSDGSQTQSWNIYVVKTSETMTAIYMTTSFYGSLN